MSDYQPPRPEENSPAPALPAQGQISYTHGMPNDPEPPIGTPAHAPLRVRLLDILRGFSVLSMVAYHSMYDLVYIFGVDVPWYRSTAGYIWQQSICWLFILVSGASLHYGRRTARRGLIVLGCAFAVSLVTFVAMPGQRILFGILHFLGFAMLLAALCAPALQRVPPALGLAVSAVLFVVLRCVPRGFIGLLDKPLLALPQALYSTGFLFPLGLPGPGFYSADYFPLAPWLFLFLAGYFGWALLKPRARLSPIGRGPLSWVGRHSLLIYVLHQPIAYGVLWLMDKAGLFAVFMLNEMPL